MDRPKISVVIPTYNRSYLIGETLESVLCQTYKNFDVIIVDDGSTDSTEKVVKEFSGPIQYIYQPNSGQRAARNNGIKASSADYIAVVDDDDLWMPEKLEKQMEYINKSGLKWVYSNCTYFDNDTNKTLFLTNQRWKPYSGYIPKHLICSDFIPSPTPLIRKDLFDELGYFEESDKYQYGQDWLVWLRFASAYPIGYIPSVLAKYRVHKSSMSQSQNLDIINQSHLAVLKLVTNQFPDVYKPFYKKAVALQHLRIGRRYAAQGNFEKARQYMLTSIKRLPSHWKSYIYYLGTFGGKRLYNLWMGTKFLKEKVSPI